MFAKNPAAHWLAGAQCCKLRPAYMIRELIDTAVLEDFVAGLTRAGGLRVVVYDPDGRRITGAAASGGLGLLADGLLQVLPRPLEMTRLPAGEPPASVAFVEQHGVWQVVAPVHLQEDIAGYVGLGDFRAARAVAPPPPVGSDPPIDAEAWTRAWESLPLLERSGDARVVTTVRWASRMLATWCRHEVQLHTAAEEVSLIADIGGLLAGERNLQTVLDRIVSETARVMKCKYASLRLYHARTDELTVAAVHNLSPQYVSKGVIRRSENPIDQEALQGRLVYIEDAQSDPRIRWPAEARKLGIVSGLTAGMLYHGRPIGVLRIYSERRRRFRAAQRQLLQAVAAQAAIAIVNARLLEERLRAAALERELALAGDVQVRMVRTQPPFHAHVESGIVFDPSSHVGGDFCDVLALCDGRLLAVVGDVAGHGIAAALLMASTRGALRALAEHESDLGEILVQLNRQVCRETSSAEFITIALAAINASGTELGYALAGHEPPYLARAGELMRLEESELVLGLDSAAPYRETRVELRRGDVLLLFTDGVVEAMNFEQEIFGRARLAESLRSYAGLAAAAMLRNIRWDIRRFVGLAEQSDDLTMVGLRVRE